MSTQLSEAQEALEIMPNIEQGKTVDNRRPDGTFGPGNVANPKGRPHKGHSITETIREMMDQEPEIKKKLAKRILAKAINDGDMTAVRLLWNYLDGMPKQNIEIGGEKVDISFHGSLQQQDAE